MSARDILTNGLLHLPIRGRKLEFAVDQQIAALTAAGYRILAPGQLDDETLERAAGVVSSLPCEGRYGKPGVPWVGWTPEAYTLYTLAQNNAKEKGAAAIRSLNADRRALEGDGRG